MNASKADKTLDSKIAEINAKIEKIEADKTLTQEEKAAQIKAANLEIEKKLTKKKQQMQRALKKCKDIEKKIQH